MVLRLKTRESRSLPGLLMAKQSIFSTQKGPRAHNEAAHNAAFLLYRPKDEKLASTRLTSHGPKPKLLVTRGGAARSAYHRSTGSMTSRPHLVRHRLTSLPGTSARLLGDAGWSSPVARQAHNLKAAGSNPAPATNLSPSPKKPKSLPSTQYHVSADLAPLN